MYKYLESLEQAGKVMSEEAWREWIKKEIEDIEKQTGEAQEIDTDRVINQLWQDGYVIDRFQDEAKEMLGNATMKVITNYMDDGIREELHNELAPCSDEEFLTAYMAQHFTYYGEQFTI